MDCGLCTRIFDVHRTVYSKSIKKFFACSPLHVCRSVSRDFVCGERCRQMCHRACEWIEPSWFESPLVRAKWVTLAQPDKRCVYSVFDIINPFGAFHCSPCRASLCFVYAVYSVHNLRFSWFLNCSANHSSRECINKNWYARDWAGRIGKVSNDRLSQSQLCSVCKHQKTSQLKLQTFNRASNIQSSFIQVTAEIVFLHPSLVRRFWRTPQKLSCILLVTSFL